MFILPVILIILILIMLTGVFGVGWYFSSQLLSRKSSLTLSFVTDLDTTSITLQRTKTVSRPGTFGITGPEGSAVVGPILSSSQETVTRQLVSMAGQISSNQKVTWNTTIFGGKLRDSLKLTINEVSIPGPLGNMPAWFVPGKLHTWAILVHGSTGTREQGLRVFQPLAETGLSILDITYRNDEGVPASPDGLSHLGDSEWQDLEAAAKYAFAHGAQHLVLYGWSMGGTIVLNFLNRSSYANHVQAVVLDSPILSWRATLAALAKKNALPSFIAQETAMIVSARTGVQLDRYSQLQSSVPVLLFHGIDDTTAPIAVSDEFASRHSHVSYHRIPGAEHTQCWNASREKYEEALRSFVRETLTGSPELLPGTSL